MAVVFLAFGVAFVAFCVWLGVRIVNRRERWAKWTLATLTGLPVLYMLSFGPACALVDCDVLSASTLKIAFQPCLYLALYGPIPAQSALWGWAEICGGDRILANEVLESLKPHMRNY
jgi:hypothetical protein